MDKMEFRNRHSATALTEPFCRQFVPTRPMPEWNVMYRCDNLDCVEFRNYLPNSLYWIPEGTRSGWRRGWYCGWCISKHISVFRFEDFQRLDDYLEYGIGVKQ